MTVFDLCHLYGRRGSDYGVYYSFPVRTWTVWYSEVQSQLIRVQKKPLPPAKWGCQHYPLARSLHFACVRSRKPQTSSRNMWSRFFALEKEIPVSGRRSSTQEDNMSEEKPKKDKKKEEKKVKQEKKDEQEGHKKGEHTGRGENEKHDKEKKDKDQKAKEHK
jgi:hypothetical protein